MDLKKIQYHIGITFCDEGLLVQALTHHSCLNEPQMGYLKSNETLAWLGDALINWVISEHIYNPDYTKEKLTDCRKEHVNKKFLANLSRKYGLDKVLIIPEGQEKMGGRYNQKNLHTVFEALVGAIYIDQGSDIASNYIIKTCVQGD